MLMKGGASGEAQQNRILQAKGARVELAALSRDLENAQRSHDAVLTRYMTTQIESRAKQG